MPSYFIIASVWTRVDKIMFSTRLKRLDEGYEYKKASDSALYPQNLVFSRQGC